jgi:hypothetical protein
MRMGGKDDRTYPRSCDTALWVLRQSLCFGESRRRHERWNMIRELLATAAIAGAAIGVAPIAAADQGHWEGDVPGMSYDASLGAPCSSWERNIFGRGPSGQAEACHFPPPNQFPAADTGYWVISYPLYGVQQIGAPCPKPQAAAQSPAGLPMLCLGAQGWQEGWFTGAGFFPPEP